MKPFRPKLAAPAPSGGLDFPLYLSPKVDGVRCIIKDGRAYTRRMELIPNLHVQAMLGHTILNGMDGELCVGEPYSEGLFSRTQSAVMSVHGTPDFHFHLFDLWNCPGPYRQRLSTLRQVMNWEPYLSHPNLRLLPQEYIEDVAALNLLTEDHRELGYEGSMAANPDGDYEHGRSTDNLRSATHARTGKPLKQWTLLKIKNFVSGECVVKDVLELMRNENELQENALGLAKRSSAKEGKVPAGVMGTMPVVDCETGVSFNLGGGFTAKERAQIWADHTGRPASYTVVELDEETTYTCQPTGRPVVGRIYRYKHFEIGVKTAPRFPVSEGERDPRDMGEPA